MPVVPAPPPVTMLSTSVVVREKAMTLVRSASTVVVAVTDDAPASDTVVPVVSGVSSP